MPECKMTQQNGRARCSAASVYTCNFQHGQAGRACACNRQLSDSKCHRTDYVPSAVYNNDACKNISHSCAACLSRCRRTRQRRLAAYPVCMAFDEGLAHIMSVAIYLATRESLLCMNGRSVERLQASEHVHKQAAFQPYIMSLEVNATSIHIWI